MRRRYARALTSPYLLRPLSQTMEVASRPRDDRPIMQEIMWHAAFSFCALFAAGVLGALVRKPAAEGARALLRRR
jgi:hypothetical protein